MGIVTAQVQETAFIGPFCVNPKGESELFDDVTQEIFCFVARFVHLPFTFLAFFGTVSTISVPGGVTGLLR